MASMKSKSGKCSNFGNCATADARATVEVPGGLDFVCNECGKPLLLIDAGPQGGGSKTLLVLGLLLAALLVAGGAAWFSGRYPGSQVLTRRLPRLEPSGIVARPHLLTVAGAAAELSEGRTAFPFNRGWRILPQHLLRRAFYIRQCCVAPETSGLRPQTTFRIKA